MYICIYQYTGTNTYVYMRSLVCCGSCRRWLRFGTQHEHERVANTAYRQSKCGIIICFRCRIVTYGFIYVHAFVAIIRVHIFVWKNNYFVLSVNDNSMIFCYYASNVLCAFNNKACVQCKMDWACLRLYTNTYTGWYIMCLVRHYGQCQYHW